MFTQLLWCLLGVFFKQIITFSGFATMTNTQKNALLVHHLDLFERCNKIMNFQRLFLWWFREIHNKLETFDTHSITRIVSVAMENCLKLQSMLDKESEIMSCNNTVETLCGMLLITTGLIMKIFKRNRNIKDNKTEKTLAEQMMQKLITKIPEVVSKPINFRKPVQHIIIDMHLTRVYSRFGTLIPKCNISTDCDICMLMLNVLKDLDATDNDGNTILLIVGAQMSKTYDDHSLFLIKTLESLIYKGAYIYARNNAGKTIIDCISDFIAQNQQEEGIKAAQTILDKIKSEIPTLQSLAAMKSANIKAYQETDIPETVKKFLDLH